jgi:hypothetical protein
MSESEEPSVSLHDVKCLSLLDKVLADAIRLWARRPNPLGRMIRVELGTSLVDLRKEMGDEEFGLLFPEAKALYDEAMKLVTY